MVAPLGNQYAVGNSGGKAIYDYEKEARDLDEWSQKPEALSLYRFTFYKPYRANTLSYFAEQSEVFAEALKKAKERIAVHREDACNQGNLHHRIWDRSVRLYDSMLREQEDADKDADIERKLKVEAAQPVNPFLQKILDMDGKTADLVENSKLGW